MPSDRENLNKLNSNLNKSVILDDSLNKDIIVNSINKENLNNSND